MNKIYTLGPKFSYSYNLAAKVLPTEKIVCLSSISAVFEKLLEDKNAIGIVPIENMLNGSVRESLLGLKKYSVCIERAFDMDIEHVIASKGTIYSKVMSHPQPLVQCSEYLRDKGLEAVEVSSTSEAMRLASEDDSIAAIGNREAAQYYGVPVVEENVSNREHNITRFIQIRNGMEKCSAIGAKTSMTITPMEDRAGLLFEILSVFEIKSINLTKIESIPTGNKMNDYIFYIDIDGALEEKRVGDAIDFLRTFVKVDIFGSYDVEEK